jgi:ABC-type dipeptide/oligopeptide/nickel transport system ATPase component
MKDDIILSIRDLQIDFVSELGTQRAVHNISFDMHRSRTTAIVGESGSGKSVTANAIMRLIESPGKISGGSIRFYPKDKPSLEIVSLPDNSDAIYELRGGQIAMIFQEPMTALSPVHTIGNQVAEAITTHQPVTKQEAFTLASSMLSRVGITDANMRMNQYSFEFSGGMRQRAVIAMALVCHPQILICDEPTTSLDVTIQSEILALISDLKQEFDMSVMFITHDLGVVAQIADDVVVMNQGRVQETGTVRQVLKTPLHPYTKGLLAAMPGRVKGRAREPLKTVSESIGKLLSHHHPLIEIGDNRRVALPADDIPAEYL